MAVEVTTQPERVVMESEQSELRNIVRALPRKSVAFIVVIAIVNLLVCWHCDARPPWLPQPRVIEIVFGCPCAGNEVRLYLDPLNESDSDEPCQPPASTSEAASPPPATPPSSPN